MSDKVNLTLENAVLEPREDADGIQRKALVVGVVGSVLTAAGYFLDPAAFFRPYLLGFLLWVGIAAGLQALGLLNHVAGGRWGVLLRRVFEASGRTLPFFIVLFLPIAFFGLESLYPWARPEVVAADALIQHKEAWLNPLRWTIGGLVYLGLWWGIGLLLSRWSHLHDETGDDAYRVKMQKLAAGGLIVYVLTGTFAAVDWIMSVEPHWFSSLFGFGFIVGTGLSGLAFSVPMLLFLSRRRPLIGLVNRERFHDYGKLMLAFTMLWTYFMISQYLIIWSGNLPEEITWYLERSTHGWQAITAFLVVAHFALPFFLLLQTRITRNPRFLVWVAVFVLAMRWLDYYWLVTPSVAHEGVAFHWLDPIAPLAIGGLWVALLFHQLKKRAVVPVRDPVLEEVLAHG